MKKVWAILTSSLINVERSNIGLLPVSYDFRLDSFLRSYDVPDSWYYKPTDKFINWTIEGHDRYANIEGSHFKPLNNTVMFRDTYKDSIPKIFRYRLGQRDCNRTDFVDGKPCSWYYAYYPILMQPNLKSFACKSLNFQGTWTPQNLLGVQKRSFFCYMNARPYYFP